MVTLIAALPAPYIPVYLLYLSEQKTRKQGPLSKYASAFVTVYLKYRYIRPVIIVIPGAVPSETDLYSTGINISARISTVAFN